MKRRIKIAIIGNSVGLRVRPPEPYPYNMTYTQKMRLALAGEGICVEVENFCKGRSTVREVLEQGDQIIRSFPDFYIINIGITDASTREIPLWFSNLIFASRTSFARNIAAAIHNFIFLPNRRFFTNIRGRRSWINPKKFLHFYGKLVRDLIKNTNAYILMLKINDCTERVENQLPGTKRNIVHYNQIVGEIVSLAPDRIELIDTSDLNPDIDLPDGIHYSKTGHNVIAERLMMAIRAQLRLTQTT
jgi:lysophospholipase L1-like esterase